MQPSEGAAPPFRTCKNVPALQVGRLTRTPPRGSLRSVRAHAPRPATLVRTLVSALALALALHGAGCAGGIDPIPKQHPPTDAETARFVRLRIDDANAFRLQHRLDAAENALDRALAVAPDDPQALRLLARVQAEAGREDDARGTRARADAAAPPPPPPPDTPLDVASEGVLVVLLPPEDEATTGLADEWPDRRVADVLVARLRKRLPLAGVTELAPATVAQARAWLHARHPRAVVSIRVDRALCGDSVKDGPFALAALTVAAGTAARLEAPPRVFREVDSDPAVGRSCADRALAQALERVLSDGDIAAVLIAPSSGDESAGAWPSPEVRALFPALGRRIASEIERGRARLAVGRLADSAESFRRAEAIDPDDHDVRAYVREAEETLALARELQPGLPATRVAALQGELLEVELTAAQRGAAERLLAEERARRDALLAAVAMVSDEGAALSPTVVAALRPIELGDPEATGPRLARQVARGPVVKRAVFAPDGHVLASFYAPAAGGPPVLREEDASGKGTPDRWTAYTGERRTEAWEDREDSGSPTAHYVFAADGSVERIEVLRAVGGTPSRVFTYAGGRVVSEGQDTNGDGVLDRFEKFDAGGEVERREEDLNGDGKIDVRSLYEQGKLVRREITDPSLVDGLVPK